MDKYQQQLQRLHDLIDATDESDLLTLALALHDVFYATSKAFAKRSNCESEVVQFESLSTMFTYKVLDKAIKEESARAAERN